MQMIQVLALGAAALLGGCGKSEPPPLVEDYLVGLWSTSDNDCSHAQYLMMGGFLTTAEQQRGRWRLEGDYLITQVGENRQRARVVPIDDDHLTLDGRRHTRCRL